MPHLPSPSSSWSWTRRNAIRRAKYLAVGIGLFLGCNTLFYSGKNHRRMTVYLNYTSTSQTSASFIDHFNLSTTMRRSHSASNTTGAQSHGVQSHLWLRRTTLSSSNFNYSDGTKNETLPTNSTSAVNSFLFHQQLHELKQLLGCTEEAPNELTACLVESAKRLLHLNTSSHGLAQSNTIIATIQDQKQFNARNTTKHDHNKPDAKNNTSNVTQEEGKATKAPVRRPERLTHIPGCTLKKDASFMATNLSYPPIADQPIILPPNLETVEHALCYLDTFNTQRYWFAHFPHAAQSIYACWSFFQRVQEQYPQAKLGFWLNNQLIQGPPRIRFRSNWVTSLVPQTQACTYDRDMPLEEFNNNQTLGVMSDAKALVYRLPNAVKDNWRAPDWFALPKDAQSLQQRVLGEPTPWDLLVRKESQPLLRIGLVQRQHN